MAAIAKTKSLSLGTPIHIFEGTIDFTAVPKGTDAMAEQDVTIAGIGANDMVIAFYCTDAAPLAIGNARVKAANTVAILPIATDTDTAVDPAATLNFRLVVIAG